MKRKVCYAILLLLLGLSSVAADTPIKVNGTFYNSLQEAYNAAPSGSVIQCQAYALGGGITANQAKTVRFAGGYDGGWTASGAGGKTTIAGDIVMQAGSLIFQHCILNRNASITWGPSQWVAPTPVGNDFGVAPESYALNYLGNYQYMDLSYWNVPYLYRWLDAYGDYPSGCSISQLSYTPSCKPYLPLWVMGGTYASATGPQDCFGISPFDDYIKSATSSRPALLSGWKTGWDYTYLGHDPKACLLKCNYSSYCDGIYCDGVNDTYCAITTYIDRLRIVHPIGQKMQFGDNCVGDNFDYGAYPDGPDVRYCYPHEVTPDFWGCLPTDAALTPGTGILTIPNGHESYPADWSLLGSELNKGDAYIELRTLPSLSPHGCLDNYGGNVCGSWASSASADGLNVFLPAGMVCYQISDRARAFDYEGDGIWDEVFITGYATSGSIPQDWSDNKVNMTNLDGSSYSYNPNVTAVIDWISAQYFASDLSPNFWLRGHSLGGQEAVLLMHDIMPGVIKRVDTYGVACNTPYEALKNPPHMDAFKVTHWVADYDIASMWAVRDYLRGMGVNVINANNGVSWWSADNPHSRRRYQLNAGHPVR